MCKCPLGKNIPGGWLLIPCTCKESECRYQHYLNVTRPRRVKQLEELEARLCEQERIAHA
ncbi:hypothetical protein ABD70_06730 [Alkalihalobacillus lehensis]|nr:hypothetical protein [Shouchella lehensis]